MKERPIQILIAFFVLMGEICCAQSLMQRATIRLNNIAQPAGEGRYDWTVFIETDATTLLQIKAVEYTLHPTFANPVRTVTTGREKGFPLSTNGWGEFTIYVRVFFASGTTTSLKYWLDFSKTSRTVPNMIVPRPPREDVRKSPLPVVTPRVDVETAPLATQNTSKNLGGDKWEWSIFVTANDEVLSQIQYVEYTLHPTFADPIQKVTQRGAERGKGFFLKATGWGTFEIAVKVVLTNGKTRFLKHQLKFG